MLHRRILTSLTVMLVWVPVIAWAQEKLFERLVEEKRIAQIDPSLITLELFQVSPDNRRVAYVTQKGHQ